MDRTNVGTAPRATDALKKQAEPLKGEPASEVLAWLKGVTPPIKDLSHLPEVYEEK